MGSKRSMLTNGLGELLNEEVPKAERFVDLFAGSGAVAVHVASRFKLPVIAYDLQKYSAVLAGSILSRQSKFEWKVAYEKWSKEAVEFVEKNKPFKLEKINQKTVAESREWCSKQSSLPITCAYGGHYFSPEQAMWIDAFRATLPYDSDAKLVALAALLQTASVCVASPGHTAQPFQPTRTAKRFLTEAWKKDIQSKTKAFFESISSKHALQEGIAKVGDANQVATELKEGDLVFIDPPYSGVHYSRFYHVLETIARGKCGEVSGVGRYPALKKRPRSKYSMGSESESALDDLLKKVSAQKAKAILTFPDHDCSNGLSGELVTDISETYFQVRKKIVDSKFSTLGGKSDKTIQNQSGRLARHNAKELVLILEPK